MIIPDSQASFSLKQPTEILPKSSKKAALYLLCESQ